MGCGRASRQRRRYPIISQCLTLRDEEAPPGISAVIVYPMMTCTTWRHVSIVLEPNNPEFTPIELTTEDEGSVAVVAE